MINITYPAVLDILKPHLAPKRSESASFLIWYFENYLRLDSLDAADCVCDQSGDKGIDGIYLNTDANVIEVYQSKLFQKADAVVGMPLVSEQPSCRNCLAILRENATLQLSQQKAWTFARA